MKLVLFNKLSVTWLLLVQYVTVSVALYFNLLIIPHIVTPCKPYYYYCYLFLSVGLKLSSILIKRP